MRPSGLLEASGVSLPVVPMPLLLPRLLLPVPLRPAFPLLPAVSGLSLLPPFRLRWLPAVSGLSLRPAFRLRWLAVVSRLPPVRLLPPAV